MFPKHSAFYTSPELAEHLEGVRKRALNALDDGPDELKERVNQLAADVERREDDLQALRQDIESGTRSSLRQGRGV